ncbi:hypothetical protein HZC31_08530 [Candidatus Woesearchaeota archaeon]|nr:hypothetical protein [Candidatus Woesearchaeota archaeon]
MAQKNTLVGLVNAFYLSHMTASVIEGALLGAVYCGSAAAVREYGADAQAVVPLLTTTTLCVILLEAEKYWKRKMPVQPSYNFSHLTAYISTAFIAGTAVTYFTENM